LQLFAKLQTIRSEIVDQQEEHIRERQELEQAQEDLTRELKLKWVTQAAELYGFITRLVSPGARFSKVQKCFRNRKDICIAKSQTLWLQSCFIHIFLIWTEVSVIQEVFPCSYRLILKMAFQGRNVSGAFNSSDGALVWRKNGLMALSCHRSGSLRSRRSEYPRELRSRTRVQKAAQVARRMGRSLGNFARGFAARENSFAGVACEGSFARAPTPASYAGYRSGNVHREKSLRSRKSGDLFWVIGKIYVLKRSQGKLK